MDRAWVFHQFDAPEIAANFGGEGGLAAAARQAYRDGRVILGIMRRALDGKRVGFAVMLAPTPELPLWEIAAAIPDKRFRDGYTMIHTLDIMTYYCFEHLKFPLLGARVRDDNVASDAVVRRLGYEKHSTEMADGHPYDFYELTPERWQARRAKLERGEMSHPSGLGAVFVEISVTR